MNVTAGAEFETSIDWGETGLAGTLRVSLLDGDGGTTIAATTSGIAEFPAASGRYEVTLTAPETQGQFFVFWDDGAVGDGHSAPGDDILVVGVLVPGEVVGDAYATLDQLFRILKITEPSEEQEEAGTRVLVAAAGEIDAEIDREDPDDALEGWQLALAQEVNLQRAAELWQEAPFGVIGISSDFGPTHTTRNSWERHALKLAPLKQQWGIA